MEDKKKKPKVKLPEKAKEKPLAKVKEKTEVKTKEKATEKAKTQAKQKPKIEPKVKVSDDMPQTPLIGAKVVKDTASAVKRRAIQKQVAKVTEANKTEESQTKGENYAVDKVEEIATDAAYSTYHGGKMAVKETAECAREQAKDLFSKNEKEDEPKEEQKEEPKEEIKDEKHEEIKEEAPEPQKDENPPKEEHSDIKTKEKYLEDNAKEEPNKGPKQRDKSIKTRENAKNNQTSNSNKTEQGRKVAFEKARQKKDAEKSDTTVNQDKDVKLKTEEAEIRTDKKRSEQSYAKTKENIEAPEEKASPKTKDTGKKDYSSVKTKQKYMKDLRESNSEQPQLTRENMLKPKEPQKNVKQKSVSNKKVVKTRSKTAEKGKSVVKKGNAYAKKASRKAADKIKRKAAKTQREINKKAAKEAAKRAKQLARQAAKAAKATAKVIKTVAVWVGKAVVAAVKAIASAIAALGWWALLILVIIIIIVIIAAIIASPYGIFVSEEAAGEGSIPISAIIAECNVELSDELNEIEEENEHDRVVMEGEQADWTLVLSVFAVKLAGAEDDTAEDVVVIDEAKKEKLKDVFWDMNDIDWDLETEGEEDEEEVVLYITIEAKTKEDMIDEYNFTDKQVEALETLLENAEVFIGSMQSLAISDATAQEILDNLPEDLSEDRRAVVEAACSLVGKVNYFWGGKSSAIGWDSRWGILTEVTAEGSYSTGTKRPFGLDCSGFVTWCFINSGFTASEIGFGTQGQLSKSSRISWSSAKPGDLAFYDDESHVGIIAGEDEAGDILIINCASGANNVIISTGGFGFAVRPDCY